MYVTPPAPPGKPEARAGGATDVRHPAPAPRKTRGAGRSQVPSVTPPSLAWTDNRE